MPTHVFVPPNSILDGTAEISGADFHHLTRVLRVRVGERIALLDNTGFVYNGEIHQINRHSITAAGLIREPGPAEQPPAIYLAQAMVRSERLGEVVQLGCQVGISAFWPLVTVRGMVRWSADKEAEKLERWRSIAKSAAEQSKRTRIPHIGKPLALAESRLRYPDALAVLLHPSDSAISLKQLLNGQTSPPSQILLAVGPEGGFDPTEIEEAVALGFQVASIGKTILRTELAGAAAASRILHHYE
ncbi:MAG: 16S rRNA (uracil(1498)-N(3))-methyltransferase [Armatimonadetes bacterium]|nr:16S rRNA (uracil(1498)-N(3))-methyltransferase [Armatimonadota bacterium]